MKNTLLSLGLAALLPIGAQAQDHQHTQQCGHDYVMEIMEAKHPGYRDAVNRNYDEARTHTPINSRNDIYTIPTVVHVVHHADFPEQNIPDSQVEAVIARMNEDYRRLNANAADIRPEFADVVGDPYIEFDLIQIVRKETTSTFALDLLSGALPDGVKQSSEGGSDAWPTDSYLNIWVCRIDGGFLGDALLGYAYPPSCAPNWPNGSTAPSPELEGVVVHFPAFNVGGTYDPGNGSTVAIEGRTVAHEVGHYLGLRHIWGDFANPLDQILGNPDCTTDDGLSDTPVMGLPSQFTCNPSTNTCGAGEPDDLPDMYENYMDYADEGCMSSFTLEQIGVMRATLEACRNGLITGDPTSTHEAALEASIVLAPNPSTGAIWLNGDFEASTQITVRDMLGRQINTLTTQGQNRVALDLSGEANGIYFVEIRQGDVRATKKVVLAK